MIFDNVEGTAARVVTSYFLIESRISYIVNKLIKLYCVNKFLILLFGPISFFSMTWSIDRGLICNVLIFLIFIYFLITKKFKNGLIVFFSITFSWLLAIFF